MSNENPSMAAAATATPVAAPEAFAVESKGMRHEVQKRWDKFSATDVASLKDKDDLISQVQTRYSIEKTQAVRDVDAFAKGRSL